MGTSDLPPGLARAEPLNPPLLWLQVSASVYPDAVALRLSRLRTPAGRIEVVLRERYGRADPSADPAAVGSLALSWWVDQLDLTGRWPTMD